MIKSIWLIGIAVSGGSVGLYNLLLVLGVLAMLAVMLAVVFGALLYYGCLLVKYVQLRRRGYRFRVSP